VTEWPERLSSRIEAIDAATADNRLRAESYRRLTEELKGVDGTVTSPDGVVTVVAGPGGVLRSITFSDTVRSLAPHALSTAVMHTVARAQAAVARAQADLVRRGLGGTELLDRVLARTTACSATNSPTTRARPAPDLPMTTSTTTTASTGYAAEPPAHPLSLVRRTLRTVAAPAPPPNRRCARGCAHSETGGT
jgi:hypothetical protein